MFNSTIMRGLLATAILLGVATGANASPVTYNFTSGYATLSATDLTNPGITFALSNPADSGLSQLLLNGTQATFDAATLQLTSFQFTAAVPSTLIVTTSGAPVPIFNINLSALSLAPDAIYSSAAASTGPNTYNFTAGKIDASAAYTLSGGFTGSGSLSGTTNSLNGSIATTAGALQLTGITLGNLIVQGQTIALKADVVFTGAAVPLPAAAWLFASGLGLVGLPSLKKRSAAHA